LDRGGITAALTNLLHNAITYTQPGGRVTLWVIVEEQQIRIAVQDTGMGIDPVRQKEVFQARGVGTDGTKEKSLAASKAIAEAHGGTIIVDSTPGKGSLFILSIPLSTMAEQGDHEGAA
jgi:two-component system sensor histidine kinase FlrB